MIVLKIWIFNFEDFTQRINSDLVGKFINIASRCASFINKNFSGQLSSNIEMQEYDIFAKAGESIAEHFNHLEYSQAIRQIMALADRANQYIDEKKPWTLIKNPTHQEEVQEICSMGINFFRILMIYLKPVLPQTAKNTEQFLNIPSLQWSDKDKPLLNHSIQEFKPLLIRIDPKQIEAIKMATQEETQTINPKENIATTTKEFISIDDFNKIDLRVAKVLEAKLVDGSDKLLQLKVDLGNETRQIFSGIKSAYQPEQLIGKQVVIVANLAPRKMRFGISEGMIIVASNKDDKEDKYLYIVSPEEGAKPGMTVK